MCAWTRSLRGRRPRWRRRRRVRGSKSSTRSSSGCRILCGEQRLLAREKDPLDSWKLSVQDWKDREKWDEFTEAYEDAISRCAAPHAPWMVVPSDAKWFRNLAVAETLVAALRPYRREWQKTLEE